ncbi:ATP-binding cassette domain-containing protein [Achromobacter insuavis]
MSEFILRAEGVTKTMSPPAACWASRRGWCGRSRASAWRWQRAPRWRWWANRTGKSTLGRCIAGLLRPTSGRIELAGHDVRQLAGGRLMAFRRQVQTIFQDPYSSLNPRRRVGDAIMDGMVIHKLYSPDERRDRMQALLARVGLRPEHAQRFRTSSRAASASASRSPAPWRWNRASSSPTRRCRRWTSRSRRRCWTCWPTCRPSRG